MSVDGRVVMSLVMLAIFASMVGMALTYPPETRLLPMVIGIPGCLLGLIQVGIEISEARRRTDSAEDAEASDQDTGADDSVPPAVTVKREAVLLAYLAALAVSIILFGFWLTIPVFVIVFLRAHERESWRLTLGLSLGVSATLYLIFDRLLEIILHQGFVIEYLFG